MAELRMRHRIIDLDKVEGLSDEAFDALVAFAKQWDDPKQGEWLDTLAKARGGDVTPEPDGWDKYTAEELHEELQKADLPVSGKKAELVARLEEAGIQPPS